MSEYNFTEVPEESVWLVRQIGGMPATSLDNDGAGNFVLIQIDARRNKADDESTMTYMLQKDMLIETLAGLMISGYAAFGREEVTRSMMKFLMGDGVGND